MPQATINQLVVNSPYEEPSRHWRYRRETRLFDLLEGRRPAGYMVASDDSRAFDDPGVFRAIPLVNQIRARVGAWRDAGYPGVTGVTKRLLEHWRDPEEFDARRFFFCQLEAVETLIWLLEASPVERVGIVVPGDGGEFKRLCAKMATGSGKTIVMAMVVAWHLLNKAANPLDARFSKNVLIVAPGLTVRSRLSVLQPSHPEHYYDEFRIVPRSMLDGLYQGSVMVRNWHALDWDTEEQVAQKRSVDKRGAKSDEAYVRDVLGEMSRARNLLVINDEAHHAWRTPSGRKLKGVAQADIEEATRWVGGLDRIHRARGIRACYDFSATPFTPSGRKSSEENLFGWIVSDFGLNDAIESGLVKTPRVVVRDDAVPDAKTYRSRLYHIYNDRDVKDDLNRKAEPQEPLPDLVTNAYYLLGYDWRETAANWREEGHPTPPVMITVANSTQTAARVKHAFDTQKIFIGELCDRERTLHIDSRALAEAEAAEEPIAHLGDGVSPRNHTRREQAEMLRAQVDTIGQRGKPGEMIQNVISVQMLSEGWDARTVTHIMGLRAFSSQLLCEQVVGRGLRRTSYEVNPETGMFDPEYVNIFGVPFTFLPHESNPDVIPPPPNPKTAIEPVDEKAKYAISWPNIVRIERVYHPILSLDMDEVDTLVLNASDIAQLVEIAPIVAGKADVMNLEEIDLLNLAREYRTQKVIFEAARDVYDQMKNDWSGSREVLLAQVVRLVEQFMASDKLHLMPSIFHHDDLRRRVLLTLNMTAVVHHIWSAIRFKETERLEPVFDRAHPVGSTRDMGLWYTGKPCAPADRSHINFCVYDSAWEASEAFHLARSPAVDAWVKNDHLGFEIIYLYRGVVRKYRPDFLVRLNSGVMLVLETKGRDSERDQTKRRFLEEWVNALNQHRSFGRWRCDVSRNPADIADKIDAAMS